MLQAAAHGRPRLGATSAGALPGRCRARADRAPPGRPLGMVQLDVKVSSIADASTADHYALAIRASGRGSANGTPGGPAGRSSRWRRSSPRRSAPPQAPRRQRRLDSTDDAARLVLGRAAEDVGCDQLHPQPVTPPVSAAARVHDRRGFGARRRWTAPPPPSGPSAGPRRCGGTRATRPVTPGRPCE